MVLLIRKPPSYDIGTQKMLPRISMPSLASITPPCFKVMKVTLLHSQAQFHHESDFASMTLVKGARHSDSHPQFRSVEPCMLLE